MNDHTCGECARCQILTERKGKPITGVCMVPISELPIWCIDAHQRLDQRVRLSNRARWRCLYWKARAAIDA